MDDGCGFMVMVKGGFGKVFGCWGRFGSERTGKGRLTREDVWGIFGKEGMTIKGVQGLYFACIFLLFKKTQKKRFLKFKY